MKLHILSDLHVEFVPHPAHPQAAQAADVVVLAGDIHTGTEGIKWARKSFPDKPVVYVAGNHEFYGHHWDDLLDQLREEAHAQEVHFLESDTVTIDGVRFLGATFWTDYDYFGRSDRKKNMRAAEMGLNDFLRIKAKTIQPQEIAVVLGDASAALRPVRWSRKLTAVHTLARHQASLAWLKDELPKGDPEKTVVVTHHYPNRNSCAPSYANDPLTAIFGSHVDTRVMLGAKLWIHGHTHGSCNYRIGDSKRAVRVICNPRGYPIARYENEFENRLFQPGLVEEI